MTNEDQTKSAKASEIKIVDCSPIHYSSFKMLNEEWIKAYFVLEDADKRVLDDPEGYILEKGGNILCALEGDLVLGVCALMKMDVENFDYELGKMAVSPVAQGKGIGYLLGLAIIEKAKSLGATNLFLESNTKLKPALSLYRKLGFQEIEGYSSPYERSNIQMLITF
ncbi:MAG: GNAT superfamily N-acetyltransferase [Saprospiraceae bacterium]|jgi:GNAT superfamily N-acetyltransferase